MRSDDILSENENGRFRISTKPLMKILPTLMKLLPLRRHEDDYEEDPRL